MSVSKVASGAFALTVMVLALGASATPAAALGWPDLLHFGRKESGGDRLRVPQTAVYQSDGGSQFVFDQSWQLPLFRFVDSHEVLVLHGDRAMRGDIIYRDDTDEPVLRLTNVGGFTLLYNARPGGEAVSLLGEASELHPLPPVRAAILFKMLVQSSLHVSHAAHRLIPFEAPDVSSGAEAVYADSASIVANAMIALAQRKNGPSALRKVQRVELRQTGKVGASLKGGVLNISLNPSKGLAGRPSSHKVMSALH